MANEVQNVGLSLKGSSAYLKGEIKRLKKHCDADDLESQKLLIALDSVQKQIEGLAAYWSKVCIPLYRDANARSHAFRAENGKLIVSLYATETFIKGKNQAAILTKTIEELGPKACCEACLKAKIYVNQKREELLVDTKKPEMVSRPIKKDGGVYYVATGISLAEKIDLLTKLGKALNIVLHASKG